MGLSLRTCLPQSGARANPANAMDVHPLILQTAISLVAIVVLALLARWMGLGGNPVLASEADAIRAAGEVSDTFEPCSIAVAQDGKSALLADPQGRIMLIKRHGNRFAGRILNEAARARVQAQALIVDSGERQFGTVSLCIEDTRSWAEAIDRLKGPTHA
jgi:hypothetical protein